jgi:hypothetical protein
MPEQQKNYTTYIESAAVAEEECQNTLGRFALPRHLLGKHARHITVQTAREPLCACQGLVGTLDVFKLIVAVHLGNKQARVVADDEQVWIGDARAHGAGFRPRLLIKHRNDLAQTKIWKSVSTPIPCSPAKASPTSIITPHFGLEYLDDSASTTHCPGLDGNTSSGVEFRAHEALKPSGSQGIDV